MANTVKAKKYNNHRFEEVLRAQAAVGRESYSASMDVVHHDKTAPKSTITLSIPSIKKDLIKDFVFAVSIILLLTFLRQTNFGFAQISTLFTR